MTDFTCKKYLFDIPDDVTYLNAAYMSPLMTDTITLGQQAVASKLRPWEITAVDFFDPPARARALMAQMIGARADDMAIIPAVSYGIAIAARNLTVKAGQKILVLADQFPANVYGWQRMAEERGAELVTIPRPKDSDWTRAISDSIDDNVALLACGAAHWCDGGRIDLVKVGRACRANGAALVLDLTQSLGVMPFSVQDVDPDFMIAVTYKWLLGPYSYGFIYVAPRHQGGVPLEEGWIARKNSDNFARLVDYQSDYEPGAGRFSMGERSNFMLTPMVIHALEKLDEWGAQTMAAYLMGLTDEIAERAVAMGLTVAGKAHRSPHLIGLNFTHGVPDGLADTLAKRKIFVSVRGDSIRVAAHVYNDLNDVKRLCDALEKFL